MDTSDARVETNFNTYYLGIRQIAMAFRYWFLAALFWLVMWMTPLIGGLIVRAIFDHLTGAAPAAADLWGLLKCAATPNAAP
jgi:hypothetical protein